MNENTGSVKHSPTALAEVRLAHPEDAPAIVRIFRAGFPPDLLPYTIYGQEGIVGYLQGMVASQHLGTTAVTAVATIDGEVAAWAQFHRHPTLLFLNHIYVTPSFQKLGVGRLLLREAINLVGDRGQTYFGSEAFVGNDQALGWYASLGLEPSDRIDWVEVNPERFSDPDTWWSFDGLITGLEAQKRFGFSRFILRTATDSYVVRALGRRFYRGGSFDMFEDHSAMTALHTLDSERSLMVIAVGPRTGPEYHTVAQGQRVVGLLSEALRRLNR